MTWMDYTDIKRIQASETVNSHGMPLLEIEITLEGDAVGRTAIAPGLADAIQTEDRPTHGGDFGDKKMTKSVWHVNQRIAPALKGMNALNQRAIDRTLAELKTRNEPDTPGTNILLGISLAVARAAANSCNLPLFHYLGGTFARRMPVPIFNVLNGGALAGWQGSDLREFMMAPVGAPGYSEALRWGRDVCKELERILGKNGDSARICMGGGFMPHLKRNTDAFDLMLNAIEGAGYRPGEDIVIAVDAAADQFHENGMYRLRTENRRVNSEEMIAMYADWVRKYPIVLMEDGLAKDDWNGWKRLNAVLGNQVELIGDDLFVTDVERLSRGIEENVANAVLIKPQRMCSLSDTIDAIQIAHDAGWGAMISHQCCAPTECLAADFTVAFGTGHFKTQAPKSQAQGDGYNPMLGIDEYLGHEAIYAGHKAFARSRYCTAASNR